MASFSYGYNRGEVDTTPDTIHVGTQAVSTYDIELRVDKTKSLNRFDIIRALELFIIRLENQRFDDPVSI
jgi:hypothetical protein